MTYGGAIAYIVNGGYTYKAIRDLSECAQVLVEDMQKEAAGLRAEKRVTKKFLASDMDAEQKISIIGTLLEEDDG